MARVLDQQQLSAGDIRNLTLPFSNITLNIPVVDSRAYLEVGWLVGCDDRWLASQLYCWSCCLRCSLGT